MRERESLLDTVTSFRPLGPFRRSLGNAAISLEANTPSVPTTDRFYVLREGQIVFESREYQPAAQYYQELCRQYWEAQLASPHVAVRLKSAWGLLGIDPLHEGAADVITRDGDANARKQLLSLRRRLQAQRRGG